MSQPPQPSSERPPKPPQRSITIGLYSFPLTPGYTTGDFAIGPNELAALDALRAERIRKKGFKLLEKLRAKSGKRMLSEGELRHLTGQIAEFDRELRLDRSQSPLEPPVRPIPGGHIQLDLSEGAFDEELTRLAEARVDAEERARGITLLPPQREAAIAALREEPLLREQARMRIEAALAERDKVVADLF